MTPRTHPSTHPHLEEQPEKKVKIFMAQIPITARRNMNSFFSLEKKGGNLNRIAFARFNY